MYAATFPARGATVRSRVQESEEGFEVHAPPFRSGQTDSQSRRHMAVTGLIKNSPSAAEEGMITTP